MKKLGALLWRFLIVFIVTEAAATALWTLQATLHDGSIAGSLTTMPFLAAPVCLVAAVFGSFFTLNRTFALRVTGYPTLLVLAAAAIGGMALPVRLLGLNPLPMARQLPGYYRPLAEWFIGTAVAPWPVFAVSLGAYAAFVSSFWGLTRLARKRPLMGAFLAPAGAMAAIYLFSVFISEPALSLPALAGFGIEDYMTTGAYAAAGALALVCGDFLFAGKLQGGRRDA